MCPDWAEVTSYLHMRMSPPSAPHGIELSLLHYCLVLANT